MGYTAPQLYTTKSGTTTAVYGLGATTEVLKIYPNLINTVPRIEMNGNAVLYIYFTTGAANGISLVDSGSGTALRFHYATPDTTIENPLDTKNLFLKTTGTGKIKFGDYTAGAATDSTGYITILDAAGNTRKLMVQA